MDPKRERDGALKSPIVTPSATQSAEKGEEGAFAPYVLLCLATLLICASVLFIQSFLRIPQWSDTTIPEGSIVYTAQAVFGANHVYRDYREPPYATSPYGPLYYVAVGSVGKILGGSIRATYLAGRSLSLACFAASLWLIYLFAKRKHGPSIAAVCALSLCTVPYFDRWIVSTRPDMPGVCLSLAGILCIELGTRRATLLAAICFSAAILVKPSFVAAPAAAGVWLISRGMFDQFFRLVARIVGLTLCGFAIAYSIWGDALLQNVVFANKAPVVLNLPSDFQRTTVILAFYPGLFAVAGGVSYLKRRKQPIEVWYVLCSLLVAELASIKAGADLNYFLEPTAAAAIVAAQGWKVAFDWCASSRVRSAVGIAVFLLLPQPALIRRVHQLQTSRLRWTPPTELKHLIQRCDKPPLITVAGLAVQAGHPPHILDLFNVSYLVDSGDINLDALLRSIENDEIQTVIAQHSLDTEFCGVALYPAPLREVLRSDFVLTASRHGYDIYEKRGARTGDP